MKILAIRGRNLAALATDFAIDFEAEPLRHAGLFAITGPTGAGKSTILDALCLALFDRIPRLEKIGEGRIADVGDETLTVNNTRTVLRRGATEGFAEVDFLGREGRFRARWQVRRAHSKAGGRMQDVQMSLADLTRGVVVPGKKNEILQRIQEEVGLSFEQFTRAVLLAQNQFSSFLKAEDKERSLLLETLTGTEIYSALSQKAFQRAAQETRKVEEIENRLRGISLLSDDELRALEESIERVRRELAEVDETRARVLDALRWHREHAVLRTGEAEAEARLTAAHAEEVVAEGRRVQLDLVVRAQGARMLVARRSELAATVGRETSAAEAALREEEQARFGREAAGAAVVACVGQGKAAEERRMALEPELARARECDAQIRTQLSLVDAARRERDAVAAEVRALRARLEEALKKEAQLRQRDEKAVAWFAAQTRVSALVPDWGKWKHLLERAASLEAELAREEFEQNSLKEACRGAELRLARHTEELQRAEALRDTRVTRLAELQKGLASFDETVMQASRRGLEEKRARVEELHGIGSNLEILAAELENLQRKAEQGSAELQKCREELQRLREREPVLRGQLGTAARMVATARLVCTESVEKLRAQLLPGAECPVCGSCQHPWADHNPMADVLHDLEREHARTQEELLAVQANLGEATERERRLENACADALAVQTERRKELDDLRARWAARLLQLSLPESCGPADLKDLLASLQQKWHTLEAEFQSLGELRRNADGVRAELDQAMQAIESARHAHGLAQQEGIALQGRLASVQQKRAAAEAELATLLSTLDGVLTDWRDEWARQPADFAKTLEGQVDLWRRSSEEHQRIRQELDRLVIDLETLRSQLGVALEAETARASEASRTEHELERLRLERSGVLAGRPVDDVVRESDQELASARRNLDAANEALRRAENHFSACAAAVQANQRRREEAVRHAAEAVEQLSGWLAQFNARTGGTYSEADVLAMLAHDEAWIERERRELETLRQNCIAAQAKAEERRQAREAHERARTSPQEEPELEAARQVLDERKHALQEGLARDAGRRNQEIENRTRVTGLRTEIENQRAIAAPWQKLSQCIGSANGALFRDYAQQLTLDFLLAHANQHLSSFTRRYHLERARKDSLALQVVDRDMANDIRSVHSLSGGESFLVSLALALGLASLSSQRVRVESLFIDEGFGALDSETLQLAMDALDNLQSQGRKVGVISHVHEMTERIAVRIEVRRAAGGQSLVEVVGA